MVLSLAVSNLVATSLLLGVSGATYCDVEPFGVVEEFVDAPEVVVETAACAGIVGNAVFVCPVEGKVLPASLVDDGICDCCDGADESGASYPSWYGPPPDCPDLCQEIRLAKQRHQEALAAAWGLGRGVFLEGLSAHGKEAEANKVKLLELETATAEAEILKNVTQEKLNNLEKVESTARDVAWAATLESVMSSFFPSLGLDSFSAPQLAYAMAYMCYSFGSHVQLSSHYSLQEDLTHLAGFIDVQALPLTAVVDAFNAAADELKQPDPKLPQPHRDLTRDLDNKRKATDNKVKSYREAKKLLLPYILSVPEVEVSVEEVFVRYIYDSRASSADVGEGLIWALNYSPPEGGMKDSDDIVRDSEWHLPVCTFHPRPLIHATLLESLKLRCDQRASAALAGFMEPNKRRTKDGFGGHWKTVAGSPGDAVVDGVQEIGEEYKDERAEAARAESKAAEKQLRDLYLERSRLEEDMVPPELWALKDWCGTKQDGNYEYRLCGFGSAQQDKVSLGRYQSVEDDGTLLYTGGASCWNAGARSVRVTLECGAENKIIEVDEPNTCKYSMVLESPAGCTEEWAKENGLVTAAHDGEL